MCVSKEVRPMATDALELEFQAVVSLPPNVGTEDLPLALCKNRKCS